MDATGDPDFPWTPDPIPPQPDPGPDPAPDPTPDPTPSDPGADPDIPWTPDPHPDPEPDPTPDPSPDPAPDPSPDPGPDPTPDPAPDPTPDAADPLASLSDEFDAAATLTDWTIRANAEGGPQMGNFDIASTTAGRMTIDPIAPPAVGWFQDVKGPYIYKEVTGDFVAWTHVRVGTPADMNAAPAGEFVAGGFVIRTPGSSSPGNEAWMMVNIGRQSMPSYPMAGEVKTTYPNGGGSQSTLFLSDVGGLHGRIAVCRIGAQFYFFRDVDGVDSGWVQYTHDANNVWLDNANLAPDYDDGFVRDDMPGTLQVGLIVNSDFNQSAPAPRVDYDYVRFATPASLSDCTALAQ